MGYTTEFEGSLNFNREVSEQLREYINRFSDTRRMKRDENKIKELYPNWKELCFFGDLGNNGEYFVPIDDNYGQTEDASIINYNDSGNQPGLWCQWVINDEGELEWNGAEKFYNYVEWLEYLIKNFFEPLGYELNGSIDWYGEDKDDVGRITVCNNEVTVKYKDEKLLEDIGTNSLIAELIFRGYVVSKNK